MTIEQWLSPNVMRPAGWALLHFLWQGTALAALAAAAMQSFRRASARYLIAVTILALMLAAPLATFLYYHEASPAATSSVSAPFSAAVHVEGWKRSAPVSLPSQNATSDWFPWIVQAWFLGVIFFGLRSAGGFLLLERMRRRQSSPVVGRLQQLCLALQDDLGLKIAIRYCQCAWLEAPAVIGWFRPIIFLPLTALTGLSELQLRAVIAHELAHVKRLDTFVNGFQVVVETLLFYHPAVWWLNKRIRLERENCCDDLAIEVCGDAVEYARALTLMEEWRVAPALAMASNRGPLSTRIMRLLGLTPTQAGLRGIGLAAGSVCLGVALLIANAMFGITGRVSAQSAAPEPAAPEMPVAKPQPSTKVVPAPKPSPVQKPVAPETSDRGSSYIDAMKAAGLNNLTVDELVALKIQNVTPEYVRKMKELGLRADASTLIGMKVQSVTPEYIADLRSAGINVNGDEIISMKVQGIDAAYVRALQQEGIHANADQIIGMKVQDITPEYIRGLKQQDLQLSPDRIIGMKVQQVTPEYIRDIRALGLKPNADQVIGLKVQDVTPEYIKALQAAGFKFNVDELITAKVQDVTPDFIEKARKHGFQNLTLDKLIQLKHLGVLDNEAEI